jgi:nucleotide-binding universal stress UspA family protein
MYRTILVPLDGSEFGERALPLALGIAQAMDAYLVLVRAASAAALAGVDATQAGCQAAGEAESYLAQVADQLAILGIPTVTAAPYGEAAEAILTEIELRGADLVVMCTHGRSGLGRWIFGSVAEGVLARSRAPILLVRPTGAPPRLHPRRPGSRLLVTLDGSAFAEAALPHAVALAQAVHGSLHLLQVIAPPLLPYSTAAWGSLMWEEAIQQDLQEDQDQANTYLLAQAARLRETGLAVDVAVRVGVPADAILQYAQGVDAKLIVMATRGHTGLSRLLLGSSALEVVHRTLLPVLLVPPAES